MEFQAQKANALADETARSASSAREAQKLLAEQTALRAVLESKRLHAAEQSTSNELLKAEVEKVRPHRTSSIQPHPTPSH